MRVRRLDSYANGLLDYHVILDLIPKIAILHFTGKKPICPWFTGNTLLRRARNIRRPGVVPGQRLTGISRSPQGPCQSDGRSASHHAGRWSPAQGP